MMRTFLTLALSLFSLSSLSSLSSANPVNAPTYVCTTLDNIDRFDTNATATPVEFPEKWFRTSYNGACVYDCEPYQAIGDLNVGFHVSCGTIDTSKMIEMDMLPGMVTVPPYLYSDYSDGTFKSFVGAQEYTICVYKNSSIEGEGGDCGYREDITRAIKKTLPDSKKVDAKTADAKTANAKTADAKTANAKTADAKTANAKTANAKTANAKTANAKTADAKTANAKTADAKTANAKTADAKTANAKTADTKTTETKKVEKYRIAYNKLRHIHSKLLQKYNQNPSKVILEKMKKVRTQMKVLLVLMH
jgi:hypothetical protein